MLLTSTLPGRHTADHLAEKLKEAAEEWGLEGKVIACVHDNARNITTANHPTRVNWYLVLASHIHLCLPSMTDLQSTSVAGRLVSHFNHSTFATKALQEKQQQMGLLLHRLIQSTRLDGSLLVTCSAA